MSSRLDEEIARIEQNEARQKRTIFNAVESLREQDYDVDYILEIPMVQALEQIAEKQRLHTEYEIIRLLIIDQLSSFDGAIAQDFENQRLDLIAEGNEIDLMEEFELGVILSPARRNGAYSMLKTIKEYAKKLIT